MIAQVGVVTVGTAAGAALAQRHLGRQEAWLGTAVGALLVIVGLHLLPDAWNDARGPSPVKATPSTPMPVRCGWTRRSAGLGSRGNPEWTAQDCSPKTREAEAQGKAARHVGGCTGQ